MKVMPRLNWLLGISLLSTFARAADLGDPAAELHIAKWVKGEPAKVASAGSDKVYVVEFWATWCPPCRVSIPHLTELQKRFSEKNVVIIGITDEKENVVKPFVDKMGAKMAYRVAIDDNRKTSADYMEAYGINGIPHAFVVQNQKVIWQGHPMAGLDKALEEITAGKYDLAAVKRRAKAESLYDQFREAVASGDDAKADGLAQQLTAASKDGLIPEFDAAKEKKEIRAVALLNAYRTALLRNEDRKAEELAKQLQAADPEAKLDEIRGDVEARRAASKYFELATSQSTAEKREQAGSQLANKLQGRPDLANNVAWTILTENAVIHRDLDFAAKIARQACEDSQWKNAGIIDSYARALFASGKRDDAVRYQEKAVSISGDGERTALQNTLQSYKAGKLPPIE